MTPPIEASALGAAAVAERVARVRARIAAACARAGRDPSEVTLVAVTKAAAVADVAAAVRAGVSDCGENRVADAEVRIAAVDAALARDGHARPRWRLIGHLQSNKARRAVACFDAVDSVDSLALAHRLDALAADAGRTLPILLEVNVTGSAARSGFALADVADAAAAIVALPWLRVDGLMAIGPQSPSPADIRGAFERVGALRETLRRHVPQRPWDVLSMGMTDDFEWAIEAGSTQVRVGRLLFQAED